MDDNSRVKFSLSLEPAFQIIYWSVCWLVFFSVLILFLETQTIDLIIIVLLIFLGVLLFYGFGSTLRMKNDNLESSYFRGIKKKSIPLTEIKKIAFSAKRKIVLFTDQGKPVSYIYLNTKNKKKFHEYIKNKAPSIQLEEPNS